ncbi:hypothetical protein [Streptomyces sp. NPDC018693]|uniref:hypothetical protein n=1 Tax=unclassified Streptomyces TaxID=2593676 RepID=UPI003792FD10
MGPLKVTLCTGAALAATALLPAAHAAHAADGGDGGGRNGKGSVSVTPSSPAVGADVALRVTGCAGKTAVAVSEAFVADARLVGADGNLIGETRVRSSLQAGSYDVQITCADFRIKGTIRVVAASERPSVPASPIAPVQAGGGGAAQRLAAADEEDRAAGPGTAHAVTGLVLAGAAATAVALRGARRRSRRTD